MLPLYLGEVEVEGFDLKFIAAHGATGARTIFDKMGAGDGYDIAEMSSSEYVSSVGAGECPYVAIPVFPSRVFRSSYIFVRTDRVQRPEDLAGKRIGVPLFTMTAAVFARGFLNDEYGVEFDKCTWIQGAMNQSGDHGSPSAPPLVRYVKIEKNSSQRSLSELLEAAAIDATLGPIIPHSYKKAPAVQRLFPDYRPLELDYYKRTRIFPIMHLVVVRRSLCERYPELVQRLYDAFCRSKMIALSRMKDVASLQYMLPWLAYDVEELDDVFDGDAWPYGVEANRPTLAALTRYLWQQGMTAEQISIDKLFVPVDEGRVLAG